MTGDSVDSAAGTGRGRIALGILVPLGILASAYALWWIGDRLVSIGPLDRAAFSWVVVMPLWIGAPVVAGFIWSGRPARASRLEAAVVAAVSGAVAAALRWQAVTQVTCTYGSFRWPGSWVISSVIFGTVIGAGLAVQGRIVARRARRGQPWRALASGLIAGGALILVDLVVMVAVLFVPSCNRPPV